MERLSALPITPAVIGLLGTVVAVMLFAGIFVLVRTRASRSIPNKLRTVGRGLLTGVLLPDGEGGQVFVDYILLTSRGITIIDYRDTAGHVFGSKGMRDWTVLGRGRRTFANPLPLLYDRIAAVRRVVPDVPVYGVVAFSERAQFSKGFPPDVVMFEAFLQMLSTAAAAQATGSPDPAILDESWEKLRSATGRSSV